MILPVVDHLVLCRATWNRASPKDDLLIFFRSNWRTDLLFRSSTFFVFVFFFSFFLFSLDPFSARGLSVLLWQCLLFDLLLARRVLLGGAPYLQLGGLLRCEGLVKGAHLAAACAFFNLEYRKPAPLLRLRHRAESFPARAPVAFDGTPRVEVCQDLPALRQTQRRRRRLAGFGFSACVTKLMSAVERLRCQPPWLRGACAFPLGIALCLDFGNLPC
mmetsp:Transcript_785/g.1926  ORF Transcript_785/g.1926 Transcript_785/m.1926 type:complete len:217 (-) Transcript_785:62-712(-)